QFLQKLENFAGVSLSQLTDKGRLDSEAVINLGRFVMETRARRASEREALNQALRVNGEATEFAKLKLSELSAGTDHKELDAVIVVNKTNPDAITVRLNYLVGASSWRPLYRLRAEGDKDPVQVEYLGEINQQSGEDWNNVNINLSTSEPALNASPPN